MPVVNYNASVAARLELEIDATVRWLVANTDLADEELYVSCRHGASFERAASSPMICDVCSIV